MERRLAAILAADVVGYSRLMEQDEAGTFTRLRAHRKELFEPEIEKHNGRIFKLMGDGLLAEFGSVVDAVECAVVLQKGMTERNADVPAHQRILERIGVNLGDVIVDGEDRHGDGVNVAARLQQVAEAGGICVSRTVAETVKHKLSLQFESLGEHRVKNIAEPVSMYRVVLDGTAARPRPLRWPIRRFGRWSYAAATAFVLAIIAAAVAWNGYWREPACALASEKPSIAVLPFDYIGEDPKRLRIADGLSEDVIGNLSRLGELFVIAGNSTRIYKGGVTDVAEVGCDLGVTYVLQGSLQDSGARILVKPQLVEATNKRLVWSETFDRSPDDVLRVQDELTASIAARLLGYERDLPEEKGNKLQRKPPTDNLEAYDYYLQAETLGRGWDTRREEALALYQKAFALDPKFADAYAGYARIVTDTWLYQLATAGTPIPVARKEAYESASRALALDAENPRPYFILSTLQSADGRHDQAIDSARHGISLRPNNAEGYAYLAGALTFAGRHSEALAAMEAALRTDPKPPPQFRAEFGWVLFYNHDYERALQELEKAREGGVRYLETIAAVYVKLGRPADARATVQEMLTLDNAASLEFLRVQYSHFRRKEDLDLLIDALREAGVSEWPYGYRGRPELRLNASEVTALTFGRRWKGERLNVGPFVQEVSQSGTLAYRDVESLVTGSASVEGNALCQRSETVLMDRKHCGSVYRNPDGTPESKDEYVYASALGIFRFSVMK